MVVNCYGNVLTYRNWGFFEQLACSFIRRFCGKRASAVWAIREQQEERETGQKGNVCSCPDKLSASLRAGYLNLFFFFLNVHISAFDVMYLIFKFPHVIKTVKINLIGLI